jgi:hypothetical protein
LSANNADLSQAKQDCFSRRCCVADVKGISAMTLGALRVSAVALGASALALLSPLSAANAATVAHHTQHVAHSRVARGAHGYVAHSHTGPRHYVWRNGHRYVYGSNPGAAVAAGVIGGALGAAAGYPYCGDYSYGPFNGSCEDYGWGYGYPDDYGYGWGGPVFVGRDHFHHDFGNRVPFHGGGARFASGNFGHMGFGGGHFGGFGGGHVGGFGGGHMGGFGGGHFGGGGHLR